MPSISGNEALRDLFAIFHDGSVSLQSAQGDCLELIVDIEYLAERIQPGYRLFHIHLEGASEVSFKPWLVESDSGPKVISGIKTVFELDLEILYARIEDGLLVITCNADPDDIDYSGGELFLRAESARVSDEAGVEYGLDELREIWSGYWRSWKQGREARRVRKQLGEDTRE